MPTNKRCVFGCVTTGVTIHNFPNPEKFPDRFQTWVGLTGDRLKGMAQEAIYKNRKLCDKHFELSCKNRNNRLSATAVPTLNLPETSVPVSTSPEHTFVPHVDVPSTSQLLPETSVPVSTSPEHTFVPHVDVLSTSQLLPETSGPVSTSPEHTFVPHVDVPSTSQLLPELSLPDSDNSEQNVNIHTHSTSSYLTESFTATLQSNQNDHDYCNINIGAQAVSTKMPSPINAKEVQPTNKNTIMKSYNPDPKQRMNKNTNLNITQYRTNQRQMKNLRSEILRLRKRGQTFKRRLANAAKININKSLEAVMNKMTLPAKIFTAMQFRETSKKAKGRRFTTEEKILSLSLYKRSPKCYPLLSKCFTLPSAKSLKNLLAKIKISAGINKTIFEKLKLSVEDMNEEDRLCTLIFDEMSVTPQLHYNAATDELKGLTTIGQKKIADHALAFMVRGVRKNYKQPVAYYFTQNMNKMELKATIREVVTNVQSTGLKIVATVCDQSAVNVGAIEGLIADAKAVYLKKGRHWQNEVIIINGMKIIPLFDVPHILKGIRNNLLTKDLKYIDFNDNKKEKYVKWSYFQELYFADKSYGELRILHKITEEHINPGKINKMKVKSATQLFSHSVAVAAKHLVDGGKLEPECLQITPLALMLDKLFDSLNSNTFHPVNGKIYRAGVRQKSPHHKLWQEGILFLKNAKFIEKKKIGTKIRVIEKVVPSLKNFIRTLEGMQAVWKMLSGRYSFDVLLCRNFNQDPIENFFGNVRSLGIRNVSPNAVGFEGAFKSLLLTNFCSSQSIKSNCEDDGNMFLQSLDFLLKCSVSEKAEDDVQDQEIVINDELFSNNSYKSEGTDIKTYVCGWVLRKCFQKVAKGCHECKMNMNALSDSSVHALLRAKEYDGKKWLCYPSEELIKCFIEIQNNVEKTLKISLNDTRIKSNIKVINELLISFTIFKCNVHKNRMEEYFEDLCINVIIYSWCRSINRILGGKLLYDGDDPTKRAAQDYQNKRKHYKNKK